MKTKNKFPEGWNEGKVKRVIDYYENQTEDEAVQEAEEAFSKKETVMSIPVELVPKVRQLLAKHRK